MKKRIVIALLIVALIVDMAWICFSTFESEESVSKEVIDSVNQIDWNNIDNLADMGFYTSDEENISMFLFSSWYDLYSPDKHSMCSVYVCENDGYVTDSYCKESKYLVFSPLRYFDEQGYSREYRIVSGDYLISVSINIPYGEDDDMFLLWLRGDIVHPNAKT